jgi:hypothetical protein
MLVGRKEFGRKAIVQVSAIAIGIVSLLVPYLVMIKER